MTKKENWTFILVTYIIPFNIAWDFLSIFYTQSVGLLSIIRAVIIIGLYLIILPRVLNSYSLNKTSRSIFHFTIYILILLLFSSKPLYSAIVSSKILLSILMFPLGYMMVNSPIRFNILISRIALNYYIIILGFFLSNVFNLGGYTYAEEVDFQTGGYSDGWNNLTYALLLSPLILIYQDLGKWKKAIITLSALIILVLLIISFKRIAIAGLVLGFVIYFVISGKVAGFIKILVTTGLFILISYPIYQDIIDSQLFARKKRFEQGWLEQEARYLETIYVWNETFSFDNMAKSLIGLEAFNSVGNYANGAFGRRQLHVDYNLIMNTCGILGLVLYMRIFYLIITNALIMRRKYKFRKILTNRNSILIAVLFVLSITPLFTSFGGQMYHLSFRSMIFLFLGAITRYLENELVHHELSHRIHVKK